MAGRPSRTYLTSVRTDAAHLAASFYNEFVPDLGQLWSLTNFFEQVLLNGTEATEAKFAPKVAEPAPAKLAVVRNITMTPNA